MLAETLALCEKNPDKCNRTDFNLQFLRKAKGRWLTQKEKARVSAIYDNMTQTGHDVLSKMYVAKVCPIAGECNFFNREQEVFSKWADIQKSNITGIRRIGKPSANGFVTEVQITNQINEGGRVTNYDSHVILKSNLEKDSDNLYYEWLVGLYLNQMMERFPIFCKTYGLYNYWSTEDKELMLQKPEESGVSVIKRLVPMTESTGIVASLEEPEKLCIVVQHVHKSVAMFDLLEEFDLLNQTLKDESLLDAANITKLSKLLARNEEEVTPLLIALNAKSRNIRVMERLLLHREIMCALYQIYFVLALLPGFSHNDLHPGNVILTPAGENKHYRFYYNGQFFDCKYAAKLIDYGRCVYTGTQEFKEKLDAILREINQRPITPEDNEKIQKTQDENGYPWQYVGTTECASLDFRLINSCITYSVLDNSFYEALETAPLSGNFMDSPCDLLSKQYLTFKQKKLHKKYVEGNLYPTIRSLASALYKNIAPYVYPNSQCFCTVRVSDTEKLIVEWPNSAMAAGKKTRKRNRKTKKR